MNDSDCLYVFASLLPDRPKYRQEALNLLALPAGLIHKFRYRLKWVARESFQDIETELVGRKLIVVFTAYDDAERQVGPHFYALRSGTVVDVEVQGAMLFLYYEVDRYVNYSGAASADDLDIEISRILPSDKRPPAKFVSLGAPSPLIHAACGDDPALSWESQVDILAQLSTMETQPFIRISRVRQLEERAGKSLVPKKIFGSAREVGFHVTPGKQYGLDFTFKFPTHKGDTRLVNCELDTTSLDPLDGEEVVIDTAYDTRTLRIYVKEAPTSRYTSARIRSIESTIQNADVSIPFQVSPRRWLRWFAIALFFIGILTAASSNLFDDTTVKAGAVLLGSVVPTFAILLLTGHLQR